MKKLGILIAVLVIVALALPFGFGWYTEGQLRDQIAQTSESPFLSAKVTQYDRGWFSSEAIVEFGLSEDYRKQLNALAGAAKDAGTTQGPMDLAALADLRYPVKFDIGHGPLLRQQGMKPGLWESTALINSGSEFITEWMAKTGIAYVLRAYTHTDFAGVSHVNADAPVMKIAEDDGNFEFGGLNIKGTYEPTSGKVVSTGDVPTITLNTPDISLALNGMQIAGDFTMTGGFMYIGDFDTRVADVSVQPKDGAQPPVLMKDLLIGTSVTQTDDTSPFTVGAKYAIKSISSDAFELKDFLFDLTISNLDRQFVEEYYQMSQSFATMQFGMDPEMFGKLQSLAYKFLSASPGIAVKPLKFTFNDGPVVVNLNIIADGSQIKDASQLTLQNMQSLRSILDATADVEVGKAMALETAKSQIKTRMRTSMAAQGQEVTDEQLNQVADQQAPAMLSSLIAQGFVVETDTTYRSSAKVVKGVLEVNGKAMPF